MTKTDVRRFIQRTDLYPNRITISSTTIPVDEADAVIARILELADEIIAERDAELVTVVLDAWGTSIFKSVDRHRELGALRAVAAIRDAGFEIRKREGQS